MTGHAEAYDAAGPSAAGSVVLDIGAGTGALVLFAPAHLDGVEIEISVADEPDARRTHSRIRKRGCGGSAGSGGPPDASPASGPGAGPAGGPGPGAGPRAGPGPGPAAGPQAGLSGGSASYAAVYPGLAAGTYTIWRDTQTSAGKVVIAGGQVTTWQWPATAGNGDR